MDITEVFESDQDSNSSYIQVIEEEDNVGANVVLSTTSPPPSRPRTMQLLKVISSPGRNQNAVRISPNKLRGTPMKLSKAVVCEALENYVIQTMKEEASENEEKYEIEQKYDITEVMQNTENAAMEPISEMQPESSDNRVSLKEVIHYELLYPGGPIEQVKVEHIIDEHDYVSLVPDVEKEYFCGVCGRSYTSEKSVRQHMTRTHGISHPVEKKKQKREKARKVVCELCGKHYTSGAALRYHQRVHTGERPYQCPQCPKAFTMPLFLQIHIRTHTGERPYPCADCPKAFSNQAALLRHSRVHTGVKPYKCEECGKSFTQSNSRKLHIRTVHLKLPAPYMSKQRRMRLHRKNALAQVETVVDTDSQSQPEYQEPQVSYVVDSEALDGDFVVTYKSEED